MASKYLPGGGLNPIWCMEQDIEAETAAITECLDIISNYMDIDLTLQLGEGVTTNISRKKELKDMCVTVNTENDYEAKFNFLKKHSETPEDLALAIKIIGLK